MKSKQYFWVAMACLWAVCGRSAWADEAGEGPLYVVPAIGIMQADNDLQTDDGDAAWALRLGKQLSTHWDVQIGFSHAQSDADNTFSSGSFKQTLFGADALYVFSRDRFRPFVLAGLGGARNRVGYSLPAGTSETSTSWMANVGAGFQYALTERFGIQADLRHVWSRAEGRGVFGASGTHDEEIVGNTYLNLGLVFHFSAPAKPVVVAVAPAPQAAPVAQDNAGSQEDSGAESDAERATAEEAPTGEGENSRAEAPAETPTAPAATITLQAEVLFEFDKSALRPEGRQVLDSEVVSRMQAMPEIELVLITGHADRIGSDAYNQRLSERRAASVKAYLASRGIAEARLHAAGKGEREPMVECQGVRGSRLVACLQPNRRVVVEIETQQ